MAAATPDPKRSAWAPQWLLLLLVVLCLVGGVWWLSTHRPAAAMVVQATHDLPAYTLLRSADVTLTMGVAAPGAVDAVGAVIDRLTVAEIRQGTVITREALLAPPVSIADWLIVRLPVSATVQIKRGETVLLFGAAGAGEQAVEITDQAFLLDTAANAVTVAVPPDAVRQVLGYLNGGSLAVVKRVQ